MKCEVSWLDCGLSAVTSGGLTSLLHAVVCSAFTWSVQ